uniref:TFIIS N-terminal domain-containing protein n=1 Tax=Hyaloperonospora arabidopsidis (strain Emoy2) TaxID=559515 RepID=M4BGJ1_HYAAE
MTVTEEQDVLKMAREIAQVTQREGWKSDKSVVPDMQRLLGKLTTLKVDKDLLQRTKIGAAVNKLKKHNDEVVRGYSTSLTKKWKHVVGIVSTAARPVEKPRLPSVSPPSQRGRRGTTVSTAPCQSSVGRAQLAQRRLHSIASHRPASGPPVGRRSAPPDARRMLPTSRTQLQVRRLAPSLNMSADERHRQRQLKYRALSGQGACDRDYREPERARSRSSGTQASGRSTAGSRPSSASSSMGGSASKNLPNAVDARKAMLDTMYPRVCGVGGGSSSSNSAGGAKQSRPSTSVKRNEVNYTEGQRDVLSWLKSLSVDMSEYAPAFFENGFDSVKLLSTIEKSDLPSLVPKKGHHRLIQQALDELRHKHSTSAASQRRDRFQKVSRTRRRDPFEEEDSDDSFVVSDDGEYRPGHIAAMFRKNRKRQYSIDSDDSINMEASFDEIQKEEKRSALYGEYEDYREDMRNKKLLKKKK